MDVPDGRRLSKTLSALCYFLVGLSPLLGPCPLLSGQCISYAYARLVYNRASVAVSIVIHSPMQEVQRPAKFSWWGGSYFPANERTTLEAIFAIRTVWESTRGLNDQWSSMAPLSILPCRRTPQWTLIRMAKPDRSWSTRRLNSRHSIWNWLDASRC